jgi:hypothetical protein
MILPVEASLRSKMRDVVAAVGLRYDLEGCGDKHLSYNASTYTPEPKLSGQMTCRTAVFDIVLLWYRQEVRTVGLTGATAADTIAGASTSLGEASAGTKATDPERRKTPRVRTAPPGLRVEPKWLSALMSDTPCSAEALTRGVPRPADSPGRLIPLCDVSAPPCALAVRR